MNHLQNIFKLTLRLSVIVLLQCASTAAFAQTGALKIEGPHEAVPGQLIRLSANTAESETPFWIVLQPIDLEYEQVDGGRRLLFATGCRPNGQITVLLLAQQVKDNRIVTRQIRRTIDVGSSQQPGEPAPELPGDKPIDPPKTDWKSSPLYAAALNAWPNIRTDAAKELSPQVADNFDKVASQVQQGQLTQPAKIWANLATANRDVLKNETVAWQPLAETIQIQFQQLKLTEVKENAFHLRAVAAGIRKSHQSLFNQNRIRQ